MPLGQAVTVGGKTLQVFGRHVGATRWDLLAGSVADANGLIRYVRGVGGSSEFQVRFAGDTRYLPANSPVATGTVTG